MSIDKIVVILLGLFGIGFIVWFFFLTEEETVEANGEVEIIVDGGYKPSKIAIRKNRKTTLIFLRKDPNSCLEDVVLSDFKIKRYLPLNQKVSIEITPTQKGEFRYACGMNMFFGKIIVY